MRSKSTSLLSACTLVAVLGLGCERREGSTNDANKSADEVGRTSPVTDQDDAAKSGEPPVAQPTNQLSEESREFLTAAGHHNAFEIELGQLAQQRAQIPAVKEFAQKLVEQHEKARDELRALAGDRYVIPTSLAEDGRETKEDLTEQEADDFDDKYMEAVIDRHQEVIDKFEDQAERTEDPKLQQLASTQLAALRQHLEEAKRIKDQNVDPKQKLFD